MQNRLFLRLGEWSMKDDAGLQNALAKLGVPDVDGQERLAQARTLFARAIETPGGLRIQTIHSFCASLLRRFPLEAGVSPVFREIDDRAAKLLRQDIVEGLASGDNAHVVDGVAHHYTGEDFDHLTGEIIRHRDEFPSDYSRDTVWHGFGLRTGFADTDLMSEVFWPEDEQMLGRLVVALNQSEKTTDLNAAKKVSQIHPNAMTAIGWDLLFSTFLAAGPQKSLLAQKSENSRQRMYAPITPNWQTGWIHSWSGGNRAEPAK